MKDGYDTQAVYDDACLMNSLRIFDIREIRMETTSSDIICENLVNLELLRLGDCQQLNDTDGNKLRKLELLRCFELLKVVGSCYFRV